MWNTEAGFANDSMTAEPSRLTNTVAVSGEDRSRLTMPVSLSQISKLTRPDEGLVIHGQKAAVVTVVGRIVEVLESSLHKLQYLIDDYTNGGPLEVQFIKSDAGLPSNDSMFNDENPLMQSGEGQPSELQVDDYIRVFGQVKFSSDKPQIMAYKILAVIDPNEITMHILEVIKESMWAEKYQSGSLPNQKVLGESTNNGRSGDLGQQTAAYGLDTLPTLHKHVIQAIQKSQQEDGMSVDEIATSLKGVSREEIKSAIQFLNQEGHLWNGSTEDRWCVM